MTMDSSANDTFEEKKGVSFEEKKGDSFEKDLVKD